MSNIEPKKYKIGDIFTLAGTAYFSSGVECEVMEVGDNGRITKAKAVNPDERLLKCGFYQEGDNFVIIEYGWSPN